MKKPHVCKQRRSKKLFRPGSRFHPLINPKMAKKSIKDSVELKFLMHSSKKQFNRFRATSSIYCLTHQIVVLSHAYNVERQQVKIRINFIVEANLSVGEK